MWMQRSLPVLLVLSSLGLCGCRSAQIFDIPYPQVETRLLERLKVASEDLSSGSRHVAMGADPTLSRCLTVGVPYALLSDYKAGQHIRLTLEERYDIGAVGGKRLTVDLRRMDERRTRVAVNYVDKAVGFLVLPIAYVNPGWVRERKIARCVVKPGPTEPSCRSLQGKSCGPKNAELACVSADGKVRRCVCQSTWDCR
jgi:hypothetical protein